MLRAFAGNETLANWVCDQIRSEGINGLKQQDQDRRRRLTGRGLIVRALPTTVVLPSRSNTS